MTDLNFPVYQYVYGQTRTCIVSAAERLNIELVELAAKLVHRCSPREGGIDVWRIYHLTLPPALVGCG